ncbi:type VI secretion system membrane subunit TssM [Novosphingobium bradum]|uniref:Type VI secretion system membrane subunit TssM n=1 Tax=Novosphingobium bradum TaxID=1737444 RepID=A0ABV7IPF1_9SPHN
MDTLKNLFRNRWFWRVIAALTLGVIVWFIGPLVAIGSWRPLGWWLARLVFALLPLVVVGVLALLARRKAQKANAALIEALQPDPVAAERDEVAGKLAEALGMLKSARLGSRQTYAYQLPWYVVIGPSGAGKTTALLNCGLNFPTAVAGEYRALRGQPITPNCDWWFTDEAVLIDTAGRYVTQDIDARADAEGWKSFLDLLKAHRPLQPLNGIIVAIPATDLADARKMAAHAEHVRARLAEIGGTLGQDLPVYLLVTKTDLLSGFREYFARSTDAESDQVMGVTVPGSDPDAAAILSGFDGLVTSISARVVERMQLEPQMHLRAAIASFPAQLASLRGPLAGLVAALGQKSRFDQPARLRGVYFASAIQTGNPVDRLLLSAGQPASASGFSVGQGRSYFLRRFFSDLVFPEQGMAGRSPQAEKRARQRYMVSIAASVATFAICLGIWTWGYFRNSDLIETVYQTTADYQQAASQGAGIDQDLAVLGVLGKATADMQAAGDFALGLGQGGRLSGDLKGIYGRDLGRRLTPLLASLAQERMAANTTQPAALYDDLKSYLVLGGRGPELGEQVVAWVQSAWVARGGAGSEVQAGELARHTAALFDGNFKPTPIDDGAVESARTVLRSQPAAVRVYGRLKTKALESGEQMWTARENAGPQPDLFFAADGAFAPGAGVPALFTRAGYDKLFLPIVAQGTKLLEEEKWVVGDTGSAQLSPAEMASLRSDLEKLYFAEFISRWQSYLASIQLKKVGSLAENVQRLRDGAGPLSPIKPLLKAIAKATDMTSATAAAGVQMPQPSSVLGNVAMNAAAAHAPVLSTGRPEAVAAFLPLRTFVGGGDGAPVDALLQTMTQLADKLNLISVMPGSGGDAGSQQATEAKALILQLDQSGSGLPLPAGLWAKGVASDASVALGGQRLAQMGAALSASFGDACAQTLVRAYPIQPGAAVDLAVADFTVFFSPQGRFARFVADEVGSYIDRAGPVWTAKPNAAEVGLTEGNVRALQAADAITHTFFAADPNSPRLTYQIEPVALNGAAAVTIEADGQKLTYDGKSPIPATFNWPGSGGASVNFAPAAGGAPQTRTWPGAWAVFRMAKVAAIRAGASPVIGEGSLTQAGARFDFRIRTFAGANPFVVDPFVKVSCPNSPSAAPVGA